MVTVYHLVQGTEDRPTVVLIRSTSSAAEAAFWPGVQRGRKGSIFIVIGLLCDEEGMLVSTEVFRGNTLDTKTFGAQVRKASQRFGCEWATAE